MIVVGKHYVHKQTCKPYGLILNIKVVFIKCLNGIAEGKISKVFDIISRTGGD